MSFRFILFCLASLGYDTIEQCASSFFCILFNLFCDIFKPMNETQLFQWALKQITDAQDGHMYGSITFKFENGKITSSKKEQINKPVAINTKTM